MGAGDQGLGLLLRGQAAGRAVGCQGNKNRGQGQGRGITPPHTRARDDAGPDTPCRGRLRLVTEQVRRAGMQASCGPREDCGLHCTAERVS